MTQKSKKPIYYGWWIVAGSFVLLFLFAGAGFYSFSIFIKPLEDAFGWGRAQISFAMSIYMLVHGLAAPFVGHWTEKYGPKRIMTFFAAGTGLAFITVSFTQSLWFFYAAYAFLSLTTTGIGFIPVSSLISRWFVKKRGTALGITMVGIAVGGMTMSPVVDAIVSRYNWRVSFIVLGILVWILALPVTFFVLKGSPADMGLLANGKAKDEVDSPLTGSETAATSLEEEGWPFKAAIRSKAFRWITISYILAPLAQLGVLNHQVPMITSSSGMSATAAATALGFTAGLGGLGKLSFGRLSDIIPFHLTAAICFGSQALGVSLLYFAHSPVMVWLHVLTFGFGMGGIVVLLPLAVGQFFGMAAFGTIMGAISLAMSMGSASGAVISGVIYDNFGSYQYALIFYVILYLSSIFTIFMAGKPKPYIVGHR
jgi:sugar phosphate permease